MRSMNGLRVLLGLLKKPICPASIHAKKSLRLYSSAIQALFGLAEDPSICQTLSKLQVQPQKSICEPGLGFLSNLFNKLIGGKDSLSQDQCQ